MTELFEPVGEHDRRLARQATGVLATFNAAGLMEAADVHVAQRVGDLGGEDDERVLLAVFQRAPIRGTPLLDIGGEIDGPAVELERLSPGVDEFG